MNDITIVSDPLLEWTAIAGHARDQHHAAWPGDDAAIAAIIGAFDGLLPSGYAYYPATATIYADHEPAAGATRPWPDLPRLTCTVATIAACTPCYLEELHDIREPGHQDTRRIDPLATTTYTYLVLADNITDRINNGDYTGCLPGQREMARDYGVSYGTMRHAMRLLHERGIVISRQGRGTYINPARPATG
jgi:hypothetical protein